jgi:hypothetical protein
MAVGRFQVGDLFAGKIGREPFLPELMFPFDFALGLGSRSIEETNVIKPTFRRSWGVVFDFAGGLIKNGAG